MIRRTDSDREPMLVIGNGMAAHRLVSDLTDLAPDRYAITVCGDEPGFAYNRVLLSSVLAGESAAADLKLEADAWWAERGINLVSGRRVTEIDTRGKFARLSGGGRLSYSKLVIATGSEPIRLPLPGSDLPGVLTFRTEADVNNIGARSKSGSRAVVIGGGLLGLEAAHGLNKAGVHVTVVHLMDRLMERQLDKTAAAILARSLQARGIDIVLNAESAAVQGRRKVGGLRLKDGRSFDADIIVMAVGIKPNASVARASRLDVNRGILVDDEMRTSNPDIFAIGECAEHRGVCYGLVEPAYEQAKTVASILAGGASRYAGTRLATNLKVSGINVFSAGNFAGSPASEQIILRDQGRGAYRKLVIENETLTGAVLIGDTEDALWYLDLIRSGQSISAYRERLAFGREVALRTPNTPEFAPLEAAA
jgi:nitrite reductase (NADH) large subunit